MLQRVTSFRAAMAGRVVGSIGAGYFLLVGTASGDDETTVRRPNADVAKTRLMEDGEGKMAINLKESDGDVLAVS